MDKKIEFVNKVIENFININGCELENLKDTLYYVLNDYEIEKKNKNELIVSSANKTQFLIKLFLTVKKQEGKSDNTIDRYNLILSKLIEYYQDLQFEDYTKFHIRIFLDWYKTRNKKELSNTSLNGMIKIYRSFFNWLDDEDFIPKSPIRKMSLFKNDTVQEDSLTKYQCYKIIENCKNIRDKTLCQFLQDTGCRVNELSNIKIKDINFLNRSVMVLGKGNKYRKVYLTEILVEYIKDYLAFKKEHNYNSEYLFTTLYTNKKICNNRIRDIIKNLGNKSEINHMHPHRYRVTFVTNSLNKGMPIHDVAKMVGHSEISTTIKYSRVKENEIKNEYDKIYN